MIYKISLSLDVVHVIIHFFALWIICFFSFLSIIAFDIKMLKLYSLKEILNFLVLLGLPNQISHGYLLFFIKQILHELFNLLVCYIFCNGEYFVTCTTGAIDHKLQFNVFQEVNLIEIEHVEQNYR